MVALIHELPRRGLLANRASGVQGYQKLALRGHLTLGRTSAPTLSWVEEGSRIAPQAIHPPPTTTNNAPTSTVGGVLAGPIVASYTRPKGHMNTGAAAHRAPAHLGSVLERQTATPSSTLPTNRSTTTSKEIAPNAMSAEEGQAYLASPSMPAK